MKRLVLVVLVIAIVCGISACGGNGKKKNDYVSPIKEIVVKEINVKPIEVRPIVVNPIN